MNAFHTVKEAALITGKSPSSIRRIIYPIIEAAAHPDRDQIRPTVDEVRDLRVKGENFAWRISEELLRREVPEQPAAEQGSGRSTGQAASNGQSDLIAMLQAELTIKNQQIATQSGMMSQQMELISGLSERLREGNLLIGSLQQQLRLTDGTPHPRKNTIDATPARAPAAESKSASPKERECEKEKPQPKGKTPEKQPEKVQPKPQPTRGLFARWFR